MTASELASYLTLETNKIHIHLVVTIFTEQLSTNFDNALSKTRTDAARQNSKKKRQQFI
jgi:hypothetical protein